MLLKNDIVMHAARAMILNNEELVLHFSRLALSEQEYLAYSSLQGPSPEKGTKI